MPHLRHPSQQVQAGGVGYNCGSMGLGVEDLLQRLVERMTAVGYNDYMVKRVKERVAELQQNGICGVNKFVQKLLDRVDNKETYLDILMKGRFAIILARNNFSDIYIEYIDKGPDLKATWNRNTIYFEVTRRHSEVDEWAEQSEAAFVSQDRPENIISRIQGKIRQLPKGEMNIVVIWSDTINLLPPVVKEAFEYIKQEIEDDLERYKDLSGVLFTEGGGVNVTTMKQFYLFKNDKASKPLGTRLTKKLESLHEQDLKQLQREIEELTVALKRL